MKKRKNYQIYRLEGKHRPKVKKKLKKEYNAYLLISSFVFLVVLMMALSILLNWADSNKVKLDPLPDQNLVGNDVPATVSEETPQSNLTVWIYIIFGAILLLGSVISIMLLIISKKRHNGQFNEYDQEQEQVVDQQEDNIFEKSDFDFEVTKNQETNDEEETKEKSKTEILLENAEIAFEKKDIEGAKILYDQLYSEYNELSDKEKAPIYQRVISLYNKITSS